MKIAKCIEGGRVKTWTVSFGTKEAELVEFALRFYHALEPDAAGRRTALSMANKLKAELQPKATP